MREAGWVGDVDLADGGWEVALVVGNKPVSAYAHRSGQVGGVCCFQPVFSAARARRLRNASGRTRTATGRPWRVIVTSSPSSTRESSSGSAAPASEAVITVITELYFSVRRRTTVRSQLAHLRRRGATGCAGSRWKGPRLDHPRRPGRRPGPGQPDLKPACLQTALVRALAASVHLTVRSPFIFTSRCTKAT